MFDIQKHLVGLSNLKKYVRKVGITTFHEEEWSVIESLSPDILVSDILKEFNLRAFEQHVRESKIAQEKARGM